MSNQAQVVVIGEKEPGRAEIILRDNPDSLQELREQLLDGVQKLARAPIPGEHGYSVYVWWKGGDPHEQARAEAERRAG